MKQLNELNINNKKYIIFDMDGTLIDSIGIWNRVDQKLIKQFSGLSLDLDTVQSERDKFLHGNVIGDIYLEYCKELINKYNFDIKDAKKISQVRNNIYNDIAENEIDFKPFTVDLLKRLKQLGFTLILATITARFILDTYFYKNSNICSKIKLEEMFDYILSMEDVSNKKPNPEVYNKIIEHYNARKEECLIFEDSYTGVLAAKNAGCEVVNIYDNYSDIDRDKINKLTDYYINNFKEFLDFLNR